MESNGAKDLGNKGGRGVLLAFEGPDIGPRPRAIEAVRNMIETRGRDVLVSRWMGSPLAGEVYRQSAPLYELSPRTLALLAACDLAERLEWEILPALESGAIVLADRYVYRIALGSARDVNVDWLEVLCGVGPVPDAVLHFPVPLAEFPARCDPSVLDLYEAGMDLGLSHDLPLSYRLYEERLLEGYAEWADRHGTEIEDLPSTEAALTRVARLLGLHDGEVDQRRASVLRVLEASGADAAHTRQVARLARRLFELIAPRRGFEPPDLELLEYACLLHDIGGGALDGEHPYRSARMVKERPPDALSPLEIDAIAVLIAIHRALDEQSEVDDWFRALPAELQDKVQHLGPLLRLADGLDASRRQTVRTLDATIHDGLFDLRLRTKDKAKQDVKAAVARAELFERAYGLSLSIDVQHKGAPATPRAALAASQR